MCLYIKGMMCLYIKGMMRLYIKGMMCLYIKGMMCLYINSMMRRYIKQLSAHNKVLLCRTCTLLEDIRNHKHITKEYQTNEIIRMVAGSSLIYEEILNYVKRTTLSSVQAASLFHTKFIC